MSDWLERLTASRPRRPPPPKATYIVRGHTARRWDALRAYWSDDLGEYVYSAICPASSHCISRDEAMAWVRSDIDGTLDAIRALGHDSDGPHLDTHEEFDAFGHPLANRRTHGEG